MKKTCCFIMTLLITAGFAFGIYAAADEAVSVAEGIEDIDLKIGLFYAKTARDSIKVTAENGFTYGYQQPDDSIIPMITDEFNGITTIERNNQCYVKTTQNIVTYGDARWVETKLKEKGYNAVIGNEEGDICVIVPGYEDLADAEKVAAEITAAGFKAKGMMIIPSMVLVEKEGVLAFAFANASNYLVLTPLDEKNVKIDERYYRGSVMVKRFVAAESDMTVINIVNMQPYLVSVLGHEISPSWHAEALKTQAVASKGFALTNLNKHKKYGFNLDNTTNSQVYYGFSKEDPRTWAAVNETKGVVAMYNGIPAKTYFFSCDGGRTEDATYVWSGEGAPYLKGVIDPYENTAASTKGIWHVEFTQAELKSKLVASEIDIGDIINMEVIEKTPNDRVYKLKITGTAGEKILEKGVVRTTFGLNSTYYQVKKIDKLGSTAEVKVGLPYISILSGVGIKTQVPVGNSLSFLSKDGAGTVGNKFNVLSRDGVSTIEKPATSSNADFVFSGRGWGHAVGISQWGSKAMAEKGFGYKEIMTFYLPGITFSK